MDRRSNSLINSKSPFMAGHVSCYVTWAAWIYLDSSAHNFFLPTQICEVCIDSQFRNSISPFGPASLFNLVASNSIFKLFNKLNKLLFTHILISKSFLDLLICDSFESHFPSHRSKSYNFAIIRQEWNHFFSEFNCSEEVLW